MSRIISSSNYSASCMKKRYRPHRPRYFPFLSSLYIRPFLPFYFCVLVFTKCASTHPVLRITYSVDRTNKRTTKRNERTNDCWWVTNGISPSPWPIHGNRAADKRRSHEEEKYFRGDRDNHDRGRKLSNSSFIHHSSCGVLSICWTECTKGWTKTQSAWLDPTIG